MEDGNNKLESELSRSLQELAIEKERNRELEQLVYNMNLNRQELESEIISMRSAEEHLQKDLNEIAIVCIYIYIYMICIYVIYLVEGRNE